MKEAELFILVIGFGSLIAMGSGFIIDRQVCRKIKEKKGENSLLSVLLQSLSHGLLLAPSLCPLGLIGFFAPFSLGILVAPSDRIRIFSLISFASVFIISLGIHLAFRAYRLKSEPVDADNQITRP